MAEVMLDLVSDWDYEAVGGLTLGADPVALAMLHESAKTDRPVDAFVVRKSGKAHGLQRRIEGPDIAGRRVVAVEDTSTTGSSVLTAVDALREAGADVVGVAVIDDPWRRGPMHAARPGAGILCRALERGSSRSWSSIRAKAMACGSASISSTHGGARSRWFDRYLGPRGDRLGASSSSSCGGSPSRPASPHHLFRRLRAGPARARRSGARPARRAAVNPATLAAIRERFTWTIPSSSNTANGCGRWSKAISAARSTATGR